jgi:signal transduction histidine kinase/ligand-binding sensor domain-containing protein
VNTDDRELVRNVRVTPDGVVWFARGGILAFRPDDGTDPRPLRTRVKPGDVVTPRDPFRLPQRRGDVVLYSLDVGGDITGGPVVSADGTSWTATPFGLMRVRGSNWSVLGEESGIAFDELRAIAIDRNGNVWLGTLGEGIIRLHPEGLVSYSTADGLLHKRVVQTLELRDGTLVVVSDGGKALQFHDGTRFRGARVNVGVNDWGWGWNQIACADREGDVWMGTGQGLLRYRHATTFAELIAGAPVRYTERDGLAGNAVFRVWEDSRGDIWVGSFGKRTLTRYDRASGRFIAYAPREGIPLNAPSAFAEDRRGNVLVGWYDGGFSRIGTDGSARFFGARDGVPSGFTHALLVDSHDTLWIASGGGGIGVIEHVDREPFTCRSLTSGNGLASNTARALVEASDGAIWVGSNRGLDRVARNGAITHYGRDDGMTSVVVTNAFRDRAGVFWFGTLNGVVSVPILPSPGPRSDKTLITDVIVDGISVAAPPFGSDALGGLDLGPATRSVEFHFVAPALQQQRGVRYAFRLDGVDQAWRETSDRVIRFEHLPARGLRFEVRALSGDALPSQIASVAFRVAPPFWRRPSFVVSFFAAVVALLVILYRSRVAHLLALERMRTRIATDLHDDLGSSLSRMSILSEVARRQVEGSQAAGILDDIGSSARTLIGALGDSIWAIDPRTDDVESIVTRSRDQVREILDAAGIQARFEVEEGLRSVHLAPDVRRHLYLMLKESLNNVARHSGAHNVVVSVARKRDRISIEVVDDGRGFDTTRPSGGRGLGSLRARAQQLGGTFRVDTAPGRGTRLQFAVHSTR